MASFSKKFPIPGKSADVIYTSVANSIEHFLGKTPLGACEIKRDEATKQVSFKASMASGTLTAKENELQVEITLGLLASAFKSKIDEGVSKWISKTLG